MLPEFTYAQARCQARFALQRRATWEQLTGEGDAAVFLSIVQQKPFHRALSALLPSATVHHTDAFLRDLFRGIVAETAGWVPVDWRPAVHWSARLVDLPVMQFLESGVEAQPWMREDTALRKIPGSTPAGSDAATRSMSTRWLLHWRRLWPPSDAATRVSLRRLERSFLNAQHHLAEPMPQDSHAAVHELERVLLRMFRRDVGTPAAVFAFLGLSWLEITRFRAGLIERKLFPPPG